MKVRTGGVTPRCPPIKGQKLGAAAKSHLLTELGHRYVFSQVLKYAERGDPIKIPGQANPQTAQHLPRAAGEEEYGE